MRGPRVRDPYSKGYRILGFLRSPISRNYSICFGCGEPWNSGQASYHGMVRDQAHNFTSNMATGTEARLSQQAMTLLHVEMGKCSQNPAKQAKLTFPTFKVTTSSRKELALCAPLSTIQLSAA